MDPQDVATARASLGRCLRKTAFLDLFYDKLMASSEEIRKKFETTDFARQKKVLEDSLFLMMVAAGATSGPARKELDKLARSHSRSERDIKPEWYEKWLDALMKAVAEFDPEYSSEIDASWRKSLEPGIEILKSRY